MGTEEDAEVCTDIDKTDVECENPEDLSIPKQLTVDIHGTDGILRDKASLAVARAVSRPMQGSTRIVVSFMTDRRAPIGVVGVTEDDWACVESVAEGETDGNEPPTCGNNGWADN